MDERFAEELPDTPPTAESKPKSQASFYLARQQKPASQATNHDPHQPQPSYQQDSYEPQQQPYQQQSGPPYQPAGQPYQQQSEPPYQPAGQQYQQQPGPPYQPAGQQYQQQPGQPYQPAGQPYQQQPGPPYQPAGQPYQQQSGQPYQQPSQSYRLSYPQSEEAAYQQPPYQSPYLHTLYQQPGLSTERDEDEYRFVSSRLADVEESSDPLIKSSDLMRPPAGQQHHHQQQQQQQQRPGSEDAALKQEIAYQEEMRRRLHRQQAEFAQMASVVPPLNLSHASTPREEGARDSLDISLRSDSEDDPVGGEFDRPEFYQQGHPHPPYAPGMTAPQRLSAQHRAEMAQVLSSLGNDDRPGGADLAIDKDLYEESARRPAGHPLDTSASQMEMAANMDLLQKIHAYNRALQQRAAQEEAWNNRAAAAAAASESTANRRPAPGDGSANQRRGEPTAKGDGSRLGQSAPPDVGRQLPLQTANVGKKAAAPARVPPAKGRRRNTMEDVPVDYVERNKRLAEQRGGKTSYSDRYRQKHTKLSEKEASAPGPIHEEDRESSHQSFEPRVAFAARSGALAPISVPVTVPLPPELRPRGAESITFDVNVRVQAGPELRSREESEREQEWAFVHNPENVFNPPSPRSHFKLSPSQRVRFDAHRLDEQLHTAGYLPPPSQQQQQQQQHQRMRSPPNKYPPLPPIARQPESEGRRPLAARNEETAGAGYLDIFRGGTERKPQYKTYTLREFKNLKTTGAMGGLGPDFESDTFREQHERNLRRRQYAQQANRKNQEDLSRSPKKPPPLEESKQRKVVEVTTALPSKQQLMKEYMKGLESRQLVDKVPEKRPKEPLDMRQKNKGLNRKVFDTRALNEILNDTEHERLRRRHEEERYAQERIRAQNESARAQAAFAQPS